MKIVLENTIFLPNFAVLKQALVINKKNSNFVAMKNVLLLVLLAALFGSDIVAQQLYQENPPVLIKKEGEGGIILHSDGIGVNYRRMKNVTANTKRFWDFDAVTMNHPKEMSTINPAIPDAKSYIYGKLNNAFFLRMGVGREKIMYEKEERNGIQVRYNFSGGLNMCVTKPIYIEVYTQENPGGDLQKFDAVNPQSPDVIIGKASFTYGMDELAFHPGLYYKMGVSFQQSNENLNFYVLETGFVLDAFPNKIPIMVQADNNKFFLSFYINIMLGKRWHND